jgi:hypothetical protein
VGNLVCHIEGGSWTEGVREKDGEEICGPKKREFMGEWRRLHNEELHGLYCSPSIIQVIKSRRMRWATHMARMGDRRGAHRVFVGRPERKIPLRTPRHR